MSQYSGYGNPYYGNFYYSYDNQTPYYGYSQPDYVTGHAEGSGSSNHFIEYFQPPHGYPRLFLNKKTLKAHTCKTMQENEYQVPKTTFPSVSYRIKGKERQSQNFGQSPHSGIQSLKGKEMQYQDFEEKRQTPLQDSEDIETDENKILNPEVPTTSPRRSGLRYEGLLKQHPLRDFDTVGERKQWAQDWAWVQVLLVSEELQTNRNLYL
ncbi:hypothetical protein PPACK8108_LOCUS17615, partial [Phakopsora pachyrhizi]